MSRPVTNKYHFSTTTNRVELCTAKRRCQFGEDFTEEADAERYGYQKQIEALQAKIKETTAPPAKTVVVKKQTKAQKVKELESIILTKDLGLEWVTERGSTEAYLLDSAVEVLSKHRKDETLLEIMKAEEVDPSRRDYSLSLVLDKVYRHWVDVEAVKHSDRNLLNVNRPFNSKNNFEHALAEYLVDKGEPVGLNDSFYGWHDHDLMSDHRGTAAHVVAVLSVEDDSWSEFNGTFATSDDYRVGVKGEVLYSNGVNRFLRYEASFSDVVRGITRNQNN